MYMLAWWPLSVISPLGIPEAGRPHVGDLPEQYTMLDYTILRANKTFLKDTKPTTEEDEEQHLYFGITHRLSQDG